MTDPMHMPENHRAFHEQQAFDGERYRQWSEKIGQSTARLIHGLLTSYACEEQAYRSGMGILRLSEKYGQARTENACRKALALNSPVCMTVHYILQNGMDLLSEAPILPPLQEHSNTRGASCYQ